MLRRYVLCAFLLWIAQESKGAELPVATALKHQIRPSVASSGTNYLAAWWDNRNVTAEDIWGRTISIDGVPQDSFPICDNLGGQFMPEVAWGDDKYLVIWHSMNEELYGQFINKDGTFIGGTSFLIEDSLNLALSTNYAIEVESNGNNFLVAWAYRDISDGDYNIAGRIVTGVGSFAGPAFTICNEPDTQFMPKVVSIDTNYLVVWSDFRTGNRTPYGQRVSPSGVLIGGNFSITPKAVPQRNLAIASNDTCILVVWEEDHGMLDGWDIHGSILDTAMKVLHADIVISDAKWDQRLPCACWHPKTSKFIVGWGDYRGGGGKANIWITRVTTNAVVSSDEQITNRNADQREPDIACSNKCFLIVWEDYREGVSNPDIYGYVPGCTGKEEEDSRFQIPDFRLNAYPNPFVSFVKFIGVKEGIRIYDIQGRLVKELKANQVWHGRNTKGKEVPSGTYFVHPIHSDESEQVRSSLPIQKIIKL